MKKNRSLKSAFLTGLLALLPLGILLFVITWVYKLIANFLAPIISLFSFDSTFLLVIMTLVAFIVLIVLIGLAITTRLGKTFFRWVEEGVFSFIPGYKNIKRLVDSFTHTKAKDSYRSVALVDVYQNGTLMTALVTDKPTKNMTTVFVPTGPNPTSGAIYHLNNKYVFPVNVSVQKVIETVIAVGKNSSILFENLKEPSKKPSLLKKKAKPKR